MRRIFVGDPHIQPSNIPEAEKLLEYIVLVGKETKAQEIIFAGDLFHTHAVIRMEVLNFWLKWTQILSDNFDTVTMLVGNHDIIGDREREGSMSALDPLSAVAPNVYVVRKPTILGDPNTGYVPFTSNHDQFVSWAQHLYDQGARLLFCHQTFDGSKYDNGFYAPDGIDQNRLPNFDQIVSGHIHTRQQIGKVFYPGTPKWDSATDANEEKAIWLINDHNQFEAISTRNVCTPIEKHIVIEGQELPEINEKSTTYVELVGTKVWIASQVKLLKGKCRISTKPTDASIRVKQDNSIGFDKYLNDFKLSPEADQGAFLSYVRSLCV